MEALQLFLATHGFPLTAIAFVGILILGVLKYTNMFNGFSKPKQKAIYLLISVGFSLIGSVIYMLYIKQPMSALAALFSSIYALNQTMYAVYSNTSLKALVNKGIDFIINKIKSHFKDNKEVTGFIENIETVIRSEEEKE